MYCGLLHPYSFSIQEASSNALNGPRTSYIRPTDSRPIKVELRRAGAIGIPESHTSAPEFLELQLDPLSVFPSPPEMSRVSPDLSASSQQSSNLTETGQDNTSGHESISNGNPSQEGRGSPFPQRASSVLSSGLSSDTVGPQKMARTDIWPFEEAFRSRRAALMDDIPDFVVEGFEVRGWGEHARQAVIIPIIVDNGNLPSAIIIMGLNSRRPYDKEYTDWIDLLRLSLNSLLKAVKGREADAMRAELVHGLHYRILLLIFCCRHLAELDRAKTAFFSNASHELRM